MLIIPLSFFLNERLSVYLYFWQKFSYMLKFGGYATAPIPTCHINAIAFDYYRMTTVQGC